MLPSTWGENDVQRFGIRFERDRGNSRAEFERKAAGMAKINLVQQGAELAYLLLHDPEFRSRVRKEHLIQVGKQIRLKANIGLLNEILDHGIEGYHFDFYVLSAAPVEVIQSALEGILSKSLEGIVIDYLVKPTSDVHGLDNSPSEQ